MRTCPGVLPLAPLLLAALVQGPEARASEPPSGFLPRFNLDTGRSSVLPPEVDLIRLSSHGEYQLRGQLQSDPPLLAPPSDPGATTLGQRGKILQWLRFTPRLQITTQAEIVAQIDLLRGLAAGATTRHIEAAATPESRANPLTIDPRWLYLEISAKLWKLRIGQQPLHLGTGLVFNDGDHPTLFGDYQRGDSAERARFTLKPGGRTGRLTLWASGELIFRDSWARLTGGDRAWQGMAGLLVGSDTNQIGAFGAVRRQGRRPEEPSPGAIRLERLDSQLLDLHGRFATRAPGASAYLFGEGEAALQRGEVREADAPRERLAAWGASMRLGVAHEATRGAERFADVVLAVAWGHASGDGDPDDGVAHRFVMHPNHNVGLVLFDHLLHAQTARAATVLRGFPPTERPPGVALHPTNGGVAGATYVNPTVLLRPTPRLDFKVGLLVAQATADLLDPARSAAGQRAAHQGGSPLRRDLGLELDGGVEWRVPLAHDMALHLGAQAGVLFPGGAFEDATGASLPPQYVAASRVGFQY